MEAAQKGQHEGSVYQCQHPGCAIVLYFCKMLLLEETYKDVIIGENMGSLCITSFNCIITL